MSQLLAIAPYGRSGASARVRVFEWLDRIGGDTSARAYLDGSDNSARTLIRHSLRVLASERWLRSLGRYGPDTLLIHRRASPFSSGSLEANILRHARHGVYDFDDALQWDSATGFLGSARTSRLAAVCVTCVARATRVIAGNDLLAEWASQLARDVVVIPSCVDPADYRSKEHYELRDPPRLVWLGSPSTTRYLAHLTGALRELHHRTAARLTVIGAGDGSLGALEHMVDRLPWQEALPRRQLAEFDIGIAPLTDDLWSRGKSAYKLLQYAAAGLPTVASAVGTNIPVATSIGAYLATNADDWRSHLLDLTGTSADTRKDTGQRSRLQVDAAYSYRAWTGRWMAALNLTPVTPADPPRNG